MSSRSKKESKQFFGQYINQSIYLISKRRTYLKNNDSKKSKYTSLRSLLSPQAPPL